MSAGIVSHVLERIPVEPNVPELLRQAQDLANQKMSRVMGGLGLPGGMGF